MVIYEPVAVAAGDPMGFFCIYMHTYLYIAWGRGRRGSLGGMGVPTNGHTPKAPKALSVCPFGAPDASPKSGK